MPRQSSWTACSLVAWAALLGLPVAVPSWAADLEKVRERGSLRIVVVSETGSVFYATGGGEAAGFDREVMDGFARLHRLALETVAVESWEGLLVALEEGRADVAAGCLVATDERRKRVQFSSEVLPTRHVIVNRRPRPPIAAIEALRTEKVGVVRGSSPSEILQASKVPRSVIDDSLTPGSLVTALRAGQISACVMGAEAAILARKADPDLQIGASIGPPQSVAFGVRQGDAALLAALNDYIANFRRTTTWGRLVVKYFGNEVLDALRKARKE